MILYCVPDFVSGDRDRGQGTALVLVLGQAYRLRIGVVVITLWRDFDLYIMQLEAIQQVTCQFSARSRALNLESPR